MEILMPSEIARLVFGYLKEEHCDEAARVFLETSPHLHECRTVIAKGKYFSTRISELSLMDILEKYCMASAIVHERLLGQNTNVETMKRSGDLVEQLRYLLEGSRSQRIVVNINVPSQNSTQTSGDSPIVLTSFRKRHHSNTDRERHKRAKLANQEKQLEHISSQNCDTIEATPLESLPGHIISTKTDTSNKMLHTSKESPQDCSPSKSDENNQVGKRKEKSPIKENDLTHTETETTVTNVQKEEPNKCTMGTSTEELLTFSCAGVQTTPCNDHEIRSESEWNDEPIENLSLLTKELLNRTELQERIAENINKVIFPEGSSKEDSLTEVLNGEANVSLMTELDNAIKTTVAATESDPVFEKFLSEVIGGNAEETDTSPDEDSNAKPKLRSSENSEEEAQTVAETSQTPLKHRLRNSCRQQISEAQETNAISALEDHNAAAVMSIINVNMCNKDLTEEKEKEKVISEVTEITTPSVTESAFNVDESCLTTVKVSMPQETQVVNTMKTCTSYTSECKSVKKSTTKKQKTKTKYEATSTTTTTTTTTVISEPEVMMQPTLVVWTKDDMNSMVYNKPLYQTGPTRPILKFIPIAPKNTKPEVPPPPPIEPIYLRAVNVPMKAPLASERKIEPKPTTTPLPLLELTKTSTSIKPQELTIEPVKEKKVHRRKRSVYNQSNKPKTTIPQTVEKPTEKQSILEVENSLPPESVTLYGNENSAGTIVDAAHMPIINLDESFSLTGTSLSPFLKFNDKNLTEDNALNAEITEATNVPEAAEKEQQQDANNEQLASASKHTNCDLITKRTPKSLMKSRSKNHQKRLSLSTPRRRNSHVRALDFNTPTKMQTSVKKIPGSENRSKSLCRTTLFKSPPFSGSSPKVKKSAKICRPCRVPIATRSPAPKLIGGWDKYTGVGMILGSVSSRSSSSTSSSPCKSIGSPGKMRKSPKKSWDADLREILSIDENKQLQKLTKNTVIEENDKKTSSKVEEIAEVESEKPKTDISLNFSVESIASIALNQSDTNPEKKPVKKYAKLKTITSSVTKVLSENIDVVKETRTAEMTKTSPEIMQHNLPLPNMMDLETPRKLENMPDIPPTPRLLTPGSSTLSSFIKISEDSSKIHNLINTPEFPPTPCIVLTPKQIEESTTDVTKKTDYMGSTYYHPEQSKNVVEKGSKFENGQQKTDENAVRAEITQFEVIKENLPREEAVKELKIAVTPKDSENLEDSGNQHLITTTAIVQETVHVSHCETNYNNTLSESDSESSDSDSTSSSNTSSSSCTSCSTSSDEIASPKIRSPIKKLKKTPHKSHRDGENDLTQINAMEIVKDEQNVMMKSDDFARNNEDSPKKVFVLDKSEEEEKMMLKETPAKEDSAPLEANISETPSSSKAGIETLTNLSSKISAFIDSEKNHSSKTVIDPVKILESDAPLKPKIVSVENVHIPVDPKLVPNISLLDSRSRISTLSTNSKDLLSSQLEKKKERLKTVLKEASNKVPPTRSRSRLTKVVSVKTSRRKKFNESQSNVQQVKEPEDYQVLENDEEITKKDDKIIENEQVLRDEEIMKNDDHDFAKPQCSKTISRKEETEMLRKQQEVKDVNVEEEKSDEKVQKKSSKVAKQSRKKKNSKDSESDKEGYEKRLEEEQHSESTTDIGEDKESNFGDKRQIEEVEDSKALLKMKVEQVKRDLFSDEESCDKRTTRSKSRQILDAQKVVAPANPSSTEKQLQQQIIQETTPIQISKEELPGVLECLQLVPANKSDLSDDEAYSSNFSSYGGPQYYMHIIYDEMTQVKKRKRRYSNSDLEMKMQTLDESGKLMTLHVTATPYEVLYNKSPKPKKRVVRKKEPIKSIKRVRKGMPKLSNSEMVFKDEPPRPLATSSPAFKNLIRGNKAGPSIASEGRELDLDVKRKDETEPSSNAIKDKTGTRRKRKLSSKEEELTDNINTVEQKEKLSKVDLENFLYCVHGSAT